MLVNAVNSEPALGERCPVFDALLSVTGFVPDGNVTTCANHLQSQGRRVAADVCSPVGSAG